MHCGGTQGKNPISHEEVLLYAETRMQLQGCCFTWQRLQMRCLESRGVGCLDGDIRLLGACIHWKKRRSGITQSHQAVFKAKVRKPTAGGGTFAMGSVLSALLTRRHRQSHLHIPIGSKILCHKNNFFGHDRGVCMRIHSNLGGGEENCSSGMAEWGKKTDPLQEVPIGPNPTPLPLHSLHPGTPALRG